MRKSWFKNTTGLLQILLVIALVVIINILAGIFPAQADLTEEKRYTLTPATEQLLQSVDEPVTVRVLFGGTYPAGIKRLQTGVRDMLRDFRQVNSNIEYEFVDPYDGDPDQVNEQIAELKKDGIVPVNLRIKDKDGTTEIYGYPYALFYYKGRFTAVDFLENVQNVHPEENLDNSIALLEYKFANAIQKLESGIRPNILFTTGHGELTEPQLLDLRRSLQLYYETGMVNLDSIYTLPADRVAALVVAKPRGPFSDRNKFVIDQYVMQGGKVIWLLDNLNASLDSMRRRSEYIPMPYPLEIEDLLFTYGIRMNPNLLLDLQNSRIPQVIDAQGTMDLFPWFYHPVVPPRSNHPIVKSLDNVNLFFPSTLDTAVRTRLPLKRTPLLVSSEYSRMQYSPVRLDFEILRYDPLPEKFNQPHQVMGMLLEGRFTSHYRNRVSEGFLSTLAELGETFREESPETKMLIIADGDIAANHVNVERGTVSPLGLNPYERRVYANKALLLNAIEYMVDESGIMSARSKDVKTRLINTVKADEQTGFYRFLNIGLPLLLLAVFGGLFYWWRRRRYAR